VYWLFSGRAVIVGKLQALQIDDAWRVVEMPAAMGWWLGFEFIDVGNGKVL